MEKTVTKSLIKIAVVGAESTGKTSLALALAAHYRCQWVPEYARAYLERKNAPYTQADVEAIAEGQLLAETNAERAAEWILICDTTLLVIKIWMDNSYGATPAWVLEQIERSKYDLYILTDFDIPYEHDPLREHPEQRDYFTQKYLEELNNRQLNYVKVSGDMATRMATATRVIDSL